MNFANAENPFFKIKKLKALKDSFNRVANVKTKTILNYTKKLDEQAVLSEFKPKVVILLKIYFKKIFIFLWLCRII